MGKRDAFEGNYFQQHVTRLSFAIKYVACSLADIDPSGSDRSLTRSWLVGLGRDVSLTGTYDRYPLIASEDHASEKRAACNRVGRNIERSGDIHVQPLPHAIL